MKLTGYTPEVTSVSGGSTTKVDYSSAINTAKQAGALAAAAAKSSAIDLSPVVKGMNDWVKTINEIHEQEDRESILNAMVSYNKNIDSILNNEKDGLLNTREAGAQGITEKYMEDTKKMQSEILDQTRLHFRDNRAALGNYMAKASQQGFQHVRNHQMQQNEKLMLTDLGNVQAAMNLNASKYYNNMDSLINYRNQLGPAVEMVYKKYGDERVEAEKRKAFGEFAVNALQTAVTNNDTDAQKNIFKEFGDYLPAKARNNFEKLSIAKQKSKWKNDVVNDALTRSNGNLSLALKYIDGIKNRSVTDFTGNDLVSQFRDRIGKEAYYLDGVKGSNNTGCAAAITKLPGLKGTDYEGVKWVPTLIEIAKRGDHNEWHEGIEGIQAGDLIITNGDGHVSMYTGKGEIQNGRSGKNNIGSAGGEGGVHESENGLPANVTGYISMQKYNKGTASERVEEVSEEDREDLRNALIAKHNRNIQIERLQNAALQKDIEQKVFDYKKDNPNATIDDAMKQFADMGNFQNEKEWETARAAVAVIFGGKTKDGSGSKGPSAKDGPMAVYEITKLIEQNEFKDRTHLSNYLFSDKCSDLSASNKTKLLELYDDYINKTGAYKVKWSDFEKRFLNDSKLSKLQGAAKEQALAYARAAALNLIKNYDSKANGGRKFPTDEQIIQAGQQGILQSFSAEFQTKESSFWGGEKTVTKTITIPDGALYAAGYTGWQRVGETMVRLRLANGETQDIPVSQLKILFPGAKVE